MKHRSLLGALVLGILSHGIVLADPAPFRIGALLCLSGTCAEVGQNSLRGIELAVAEINSAGGILGRNVEIVTQDTREFTSAASAVSAYRNLRLDGDVHFVIGPTWTTGGLPLIPIMSKQTDVVITSPSLGVADFNEAADHMFNTWPHDSIGTKALAKYAIDKGWKRAAIFSSQDPWEVTQGRIFDEEFKKLGGTVSARVEPLADAADLRTEAIKIKNSKPDVVFFSNYAQIHVACKELRRLQYQGAKLAILIDDTRLSNSDGAIDGSIIAMFEDPTQAFLDSFKAKFKEEAGISANTAYDAMRMYALAIEQAKSDDVSKVVPILQSMRFQGASGEVVFDKDGGVIREPIFITIKDSKKVPL